VLHIVTTNNSEVFRHLGAKVFQVLGLDHSIASDYWSVLELVRTKQPQIAILDAELPGGDGYAACRELKQDPELKELRIMLALTSVMDRRQLDLIKESRCDDVLAMPMHSDEFYRHVVGVTGLPFRQHDRVRVELEAAVEASGEALSANIEDISLGGLGLRTERRLRSGDQVTVRIKRDDKSYPEGVMVVAWTRDAADGEFHAGLTFGELPPETRELVEEICLFDVSPAEEGGVSVRLHGDLTERSDLSHLTARLSEEARIEFSMREVRYMSSAGVRIWCQFLAELSGKNYSFRHASLAFAAQVAMVPLAAGNGVIKSFEAPYLCDECDHEDVRLIETNAVLMESGDIDLPTLHCGTCGGDLVFDDVPRRFCAFLLRR